MLCSYSLPSTAMPLSAVSVFSILTARTKAKLGKLFGFLRICEHCLCAIKSHSQLRWKYCPILHTWLVPKYCSGSVKRSSPLCHLMREVRENTDLLTVKSKVLSINSFPKDCCHIPKRACLVLLFEDCVFEIAFIL